MQVWVCCRRLQHADSGCAARAQPGTVGYLCTTMHSQPSEQPLQDQKEQCMHVTPLCSSSAWLVFKRGVS